MDTRAKRKWVIAAVILLVAAALGAACMNVCHGANGESSIVTVMISSDPPNMNMAINKGYRKLNPSV